MNDYEIGRKLRECLVHVTDAKITERKKHVEILKAYLTQSAYLQHLNKSSAKGSTVAERGGISITWSKVFSKIRDYIELECNKFKDKEAKKENLSAIVRNNLEKEKKACSDLFRCFVKALKLNKQYELVTPIVNHILAVLHDSYTQIALGLDYSNTFLKFILYDPFMCLNIPLEILDESIWFYQKIIKNPPLNWNRSVTTEILLHIVTLRLNMGSCDLKILDFFVHMFEALMLEKASRHHENLLQCLLLICQNLKNDYPLLLCDVGEHVLLPIMQLWKTRPTEKIQDLMLEFIRFQLALHHPKGAHKGEDGAQAFDWSNWKNHLTNMYKLIMTELATLCNRNKYPFGKELILKPALISVAIEVCAQVFVEPIDVLDVTQASTSFDTSMPLKKRKIDVSFRALIDNLSSSKIIPWLQVISAFLIKYSSIISEPEAACLLDALIDIHMSCNNIETKNWLLQCCQSFVQAFGSEDTLKKGEATFQWQRLWELGVKSVALMHQCQEAGHSLLAILLKYKLITPKTEFYNLYTPGSSNKVTKASLKSLAIFLERFSSSSILEINLFNSRNLSSDNFINQVLEWLFSRKNDDNSPFQVVCDDVDLSTYEMFAHVAALLCLQNNDCGIKTSISTPFTEPFQWINEVEDELVFITFGIATNPMKTKESKTYPASSIISQPVWEKILKLFIEATGSIFEEQICNTQISSSSSFIRHSCLLFEMQHVFYFEGIIKKEELESNVIMSYLKRSLQAVAEILKKNEADSNNVILLKDFIQRIILVINHKCEIYDQEFSEYFMFQIIKSIPEEILMNLLNYGLISCANVIPEVCENIQEVDPFEDEFAEPQRRLSLGKEEKSDFESNTEKESFQLMDTKNFPEDFHLQMQCLDVVGQFLHLLVNESFINNVNGFPSSMLKKLVSSLPDKNKRYTGAADIHLVLQLLKCILLTKNLDEEVIEKVLHSIRLTLNQLSQMQDLTQTVLKLFPLLFDHIYNRSSITSPNLTKNKSRMLHLIFVLCKKELDEKCSSLTSLCVVKNLLKIIHLDPNSSWNRENSTSNGGRVSEKSGLIIESLAQFMNSSFTSVRLFVARNINKIIAADVSDRIFQEICSKTFEFLMVFEKENLSQKDEFSNRVKTFLHYLVHVVQQFPCLEIESIFVMLKCVKFKFADQVLISMVLKQIANALGYESSRDFIEPHLNHLCQRWFDAKFKLEEFPFFILGVNSSDYFIKDFSKILVPLLFYNGDMPSLSIVAEKLNMSTPDVLQLSLPCIQSLILTAFALNRNTKNASKCQQLLLSNIPQELYVKQAIAKLDELVVCLLSLIRNEETDHSSMCQIFNKCSINSEEFVKTVSYIMSETNFNGSFTSFLTQKADCIQRIFLSLSIMLHKALRSHESRRILNMYQSFLSLLLPGLKSDLNCSIFVIREIIYSMINFLTDKRYLKEYIVRDDICIESCCNIIFCLCKEAVEDFKDTIGEYLPFIMSNLTPFVGKSACGKKVLSLLKFLLIDCENHLVQYIPYLDPFPNDDVFASLALQHRHVKYKFGNLTLEQEIQFFLKSCKMMGRASKNGLNHVCNQINTRKEDFLKILNDLKEKNIFTEDVEKSILHQLICQLAYLCSTDNDFEIQKAASNCLGVIGPVCFSSVVLQPSPHAVTEKGHEILTTLQKSFVAILNTLVEYLFHKSIHIKVAASKVLKDIFSTKIGYSFFREYGKHFKNSNIIKYANPFFACQNSKELLQSCKYKLNLENLQISIWIPHHDEHFEWIKNLVCTLLESGCSKNNFYECLVPLCKEEASFCERFIPYLVHMILLTENQDLQKFLSSGISSFFSHFSQWMEKSSNDKEFYSTPPSDAIFHKASVQTMLSLLHYIWLHPSIEEKRPRNVLKDLWMDINYLDVAQAAQYCSAHFTAILYVELWCDLEREKNRISTESNNNSDSGSLDSSPLSFIGSQDHEKAALVYDILLDSYTRIGDSDAISGCDLVTADSRTILKHSYLIEKKWDGLLKLSDIQNSKLETLQALQLTGLNHTLLGYSQSLLQNKNFAVSQDIVEYHCQAAWRMNQWDLPVVESPTHGFQEYFYKSQQSFISENRPMFHKYLDLARKTEFEKLNNTSLESVRNILSVLSNAQLITVLEDFSSSHSNIESLKKLLDAWKFNDEMPYDDFEFVEPISWLKCVLLKHQVDLDVNKHIIIPELKKLLEKHCVRARNELYLEIACSAVHTLRNLPCIAKSSELLWQMEEAKILWTKKEYSIASKILKSTLHSIELFVKENSDFLMSYGEALTLRGKWLAETCNENSSVIMRDYLEKAVEVLENSDCSSDQTKSSAMWDAYLAVARYADAQYQSIVNYKKSTAFHAKQELMESSKKEIKKLKTTATTDDQRKTYLILSKQLQIDQDEIKSLEQDQKQFLNKAITSYLKCLRGTDAHDLWVFRLVSLWFQNLTDEQTNNIIQNKIKELESYKFLPLMYQLAARMGTQASIVFSNTLTDLIMQITIDHPHHALPVILALSNADKDPVDGQKDSSHPSSTQQSDVSSVKDRMVAAKKIISYIYKSKIGALAKGYAELCDAYIYLAYHPVEKKAKRCTIPAGQPLLKFRNLQNIPIITEEVKVDRTCEYKNLIGIHSFGSEFRLCGGLTLPKVIKCLGTDGIEREQLVKGRDDLRQDAVMQQVFSLVNHLLERETETKRRRLHIRTYKVVPVSRRSGVLQWCEGTQVLSQYLTGNNGAHARYYPKMASHLDCRKKMESIASESLLQRKRDKFDNICANFPPVFRYFFLEHFPEPSAWFERRLCYTKSVAASSIVGYILGLGDRHVNNILIDKNTAEVVHIDFGIAFEKGRVLATPETVPFRLTRDIVDGMGISAVEGTFKRCSEKTLEVMRKSQDVLLTILDVLLHDPLYEWTIPPSKSPSQASAKVAAQEVNKLAERALMRLQEKLQGLEEGVAMSIEGQVNLLIQQARDPNNLCRLYAGWQPYL